MAAGVSGGGPILRPLDWYREIAGDSRTRREKGFFLIEGFRAIGQIAASHPAAIDEILLDETADQSAPFERFPLRKLTRQQLKSIAASATSQGVIAVVRLPADSGGSEIPEHPGSRIILLEDLQDPGNVGTLLRTAAAFGIDGVLMSRQCADPFGPKAVQASAGAVLTPWIRRTDSYLDAVETLQHAGYHLFCTDLHADAAVDFTTATRSIIAFGNEGSGLSEQLLSLADSRFSIPMVPGAVESLNVAVSAAITMFVMFRTGGWQ
jgi:RNA methyltransferase, TrmH family